MLIYLKTKSYPPEFNQSVQGEQIEHLHSGFTFGREQQAEQVQRDDGQDVEDKTPALDVVLSYTVKVFVCACEMGKMDKLWL